MTGAASATREPASGAQLLTRILAEATGEDAQLRALHRVLSDELELPADVHVVGEPLVLVAVEYDGNPRRGLVARVRRDDGAEHRIGLADVAMRAGTPAIRYLAAYRAWLGVVPAASGSTAAPRGRQHKASEDDLDLSKPVDLVVLAVKERAARCRLLGSERVITLRAGSLHRVVAGQIATVQPNKHWRHAGHPYLSGRIVGTRIDATALGLVPLALRGIGDWDPADHDWGDPPLDAWVASILTRGRRPSFEMELPAIGAALLLDDEAAAKLLELDLRYLDAHTYLGNRLLGFSPEWALHHYEVGGRIGELSIGDGFEGVLPWGLVGNRPFLSCLAGLASCLWRLGRWDEAERVLEQVVRLDPTDHQDLRPQLSAVRAREPWSDDGAWR